MVFGEPATPVGVVLVGKLKDVRELVSDAALEALEGEMEEDELLEGVVTSGTSTSILSTVISEVLFGNRVSGRFQSRILCDPAVSQRLEYKSI